MKKLVGLLLAGLAMISMTFMSCSAETDSPSAPAFEVTYGDRTEPLDEISVDLTKGKMPSIYLFSEYYDKLEVIDAFIEETDDALEFDLGRASKQNKNVQLKIEDFLDYVSEPGEYTIILIIACDGVLKEEYELPVTVVVTNGIEPIVYKPSITTNLPEKVDIGATLNVVASIPDGEIKYQWYKDGVAINGATKASYEAKEKGTYYVRVSNAVDPSKYVDSVNTKVSDPVNPDVVEVQKQPTALVIANLSTNSSQLLTASAKTNAGAAISAQWFKEGVSVSAVENGTGSIESTLKPTEFGTYICKFTSGSESVSSNAVEVTEASISQGLVIDGILEGVTVNVRDAIKISPRSDVPCTYTYQWWAHGETSGGDWEIEGATSDTYTVTDLEYDEGDVEYGIYCVVTFNSTQSGQTHARQTAVAKFVKPQPGDPEVPAFTTDLTEPTINCYVGENVTLEVAATVTDGGTVTYRWLKDGAPIEGATSASYKVDTSAVGEAKYVAVAINTLNGKTKEKQSATTVVKVAAKDNNGNVSGGFDFN